MNDKDRDQNNALTLRSGSVERSDRLTSLIYDLLRDHLPAGTLERLVRDLEQHPGPFKFSNGWLATYAEDLSQRIMGVKD